MKMPASDKFTQENRPEKYIKLIGPLSLEQLREGNAGTSRGNIGAKPDANGAEILQNVRKYLLRFVSYPSDEACVAHTLWIAHTHLMDVWESTPRLAFLSPEPASGKTRALEITALLVPRPVESVNATPAYLFRKVGANDGLPTILYDEIDTIFGPKARENEEIRGLINAGHRRGAGAGRCVMRGKVVETEEISAYCAVALAGIGKLPDTILSRSVIIRMRRRATNERIEPYRRRLHAGEGEELRERLAAWADGAIDKTGFKWPSMPNEIIDRDADVWEPLIAVADLAGGDWPHRARVAAVALVAASKDDTPSLGIRLLSDLHKIFGSRQTLSTETILSELNKLEEAPWGGDDFRPPLNDRGLAKLLRRYGVRPKTVRIDGKTPKGYSSSDLSDAWKRYVKASSP